MRMKGSALQARMQALRHEQDGVVIKKHTEVFENDELEIESKKTQEYIDLDGDGDIDLMKQAISSFSSDGSLSRSSETLIERVDDNHFHKFTSHTEAGRLNRDLYTSYQFEHNQVHEHSFANIKKGDVNYRPGTEGFNERDGSYVFEGLHEGYNKQVDFTPTENLFLDKYGDFLGVSLESLEGYEQGNLYVDLAQGPANPDLFGPGRIQEVLGYDASGNGNIDALEIKIYYHGRQIKQFVLRDRNEDGIFEETSQFHASDKI